MKFLILQILVIILFAATKASAIDTSQIDMEDLKDPTKGEHAPIVKVEELRCDVLSVSYFLHEGEDISNVEKETENTLLVATRIHRAVEGLDIYESEGTFIVNGIVDHTYSSVRLTQTHALDDNKYEEVSTTNKTITLPNGNEASPQIFQSQSVYETQDDGTRRLVSENIGGTPQEAPQNWEVIVNDQIRYRFERQTKPIEQKSSSGKFVQETYESNCRFLIKK